MVLNLNKLEFPAPKNELCQFRISHRPGGKAGESLIHVGIGLSFSTYWGVGFLSFGHRWDVGHVFFNIFSMHL